LDAHALVAVGSDDPGYTASKIYPYLLARKPLLAIYHNSSSVVGLIRRVGGGVCVPFDTPANEAVLSECLIFSWLSAGQYRQTLPLDVCEFEQHTDRGCAVELCAFLQQCLAQA
jgi:hypothetical protein